MKYQDVGKMWGSFLSLQSDKGKRYGNFELNYQVGTKSYFRNSMDSFA